MNNINVTKISSKGQVVIPLDMRAGLSAGDKLVIIQNKDQLILKKMEAFSKNLEEDLEFAKRTEEAYKRHEKGEFIQMDADDFLKEIERW